MSRAWQTVQDEVKADPLVLFVETTFSSIGSFELKVLHHHGLRCSKVC